MNINFEVKGQDLRVRAPLIVGGSWHYLGADFYFNSEWSGLRKVLVFVKGSERHEVEPVGETVSASAGAFDFLTAGDWTVSIYGYKLINNTKTKQITTSSARIRVLEGGPITESEAPRETLI